MKKLLKNYISTFDGLSKEVWWLSLITLINRAGTMVIPFLSLYLTEDLGFTLSNVGTIMTAFGLGSVIGSWLGGKLTDKIGYYKIMVFSLFISGFMFIGLQYLKTIYTLSLGIFALMVVADMFRPAMFVALSAYSKPENKTRSVTLIRLAINLGFSAGPAVGGLIIVSLGYGGLFWVDGITCIAATLLLIKVLNPKKTRVQDEIKVDNPYSAYKDKPFIIFLFALFLFGFIFLQYFSTMPLYYRERHLLSELEIGLLLGANGFFIFLLEMPLIKYLENTRFAKTSLILFGAFLTAISFLILNFSNWSGILIFAMFLMTLGEMIAFPFANAFALQQAKKGNQGEYMALYSIAFSFAHIFGHKSGMELVEGVGYDNTWYIMTVLGGLCMLLLYILNQFIKRKKLVR
ncbi:MULTISPECIES: MDR family MFS transporter [Olleya]|uniref:Predicted arabinose efflux permease, MFS family n=1 Tax=Olleya namhaensis TaxID=1144750 RepID=A0A1I3PS75_9FLAO|nr:MULTISPECIES: MFS transporter [Olleya]PKG51504.1 MFS transporter [Olleya sp. 1-3]SFJ24373.1 Predicted arabinose efflux permease, MFS family [Olleya namhaensis]